MDRKPCFRFGTNPSFSSDTIRKLKQQIRGANFVILSEAKDLPMIPG